MRVGAQAKLLHTTVIGLALLLAMAATGTATCPPTMTYPTGTTASDNEYTDKVLITWNASVDAIGYRVWRAPGEYMGIWYTEIGTTSDTSYADTTAVPGKLYKYKVQGIWGPGCTLTSGVDTGSRRIEAPTGVSATTRYYADRIAVSWGAATGAVSYNIWRKDAWGTWAIIGTCSTTSYTDTAIVAHRTYGYRVQALAPDDGLGPRRVSDLSEPAWGIAGACPTMTYPTGTSASDNEYTDKVRITWNAPPYATKYNVYRAEAGSSSYTRIGTIHDPWYDDTSAEPGKLYQYKVQAEWFYCGSLTSAVDAGSRKLLTPTGVSASVRTYNDRIAVSWNAVSGAESYNIWRKDGWSSWEIVDASATTAYMDTAIVAHRTYGYIVQAVAAGGESELSAPAWGVAGACPTMTYPTGTSASDNEYTDKIRITWDPTPYATKYIVYRAPYEYTGFRYTEIGAAHDPEYDDTSAEPGKRYKYKVQAVWYGCGSLTSAVDAGSRKLLTPTGVSASVRTYNDRIAVSWNAVSGAESYNIWRKDGWSSWEIVDASATTAYMDTAIVAHRTYGYIVQAVAAGGESELSAPAWGVAGACPTMTYPTGTSASDNEYTDKIRITWDPTPYATKYIVYRAPYEYTGFRYTEIGAAHDPEYDDTSAEPGKRYKYKVQAVWYGCGSLTSAVDAGSRKLAAPTGVSASDAAFVDRIIVTWNAVPGADEYAILRAESDSGPFTVIGSSSTTTYEDLAAPCSAWYAVEAVADGGASDPSSADQGSRIDDQPPILVIPADVTTDCCDCYCDPASTGLATATDNCDPAPTITYSNWYSIGRDKTRVERTWTAADSSGNESSGVQLIWFTAPDVNVLSIDPIWVTSLPAQVGVDFIIEKCATTAWLWTRCNENWSVHFNSAESAVVADGVTVNHQDVPLPSDAPEGTYALMGTFMRAPCYPGTRRAGPWFVYGIDLTPPEDPVASSSSHGVSIWSNDPNVAIGVSGATDAVSGVDGFEAAWDQSAAWSPTQAKTHEEDWVGDTFTATADGDWYFHLATVDNAGNWTSTIHLGPFHIDTTPPEFVDCPDDLIWYAPSGETAAAAYWTPPTVTDNLDPSPALAATAVPGNTFPLGDTLIEYDAADSAGNTATCTFVLSVLEQAAPSGVVETMTEEFEGSDYDPGEVAVIVNVASQAIADGAPAGTTSSVLDGLIDEGLSFDEFVEQIELYAALIEEGVPPGKAMNEILGRGNSKK